MKIKKLLSSLLLGTVLLSLNACNKENAKDKKDTSSPIGHVTTSGAPGSSIQQTYIKDIKAVGAYWDKYAYNGAGVLKDYYGLDYTRLSDWNLNCDCGTTTDCIYLYESRTIHAEEAITDIIAVTQRSVSKNFVWNNRNYEVVGGVRVNGLNSSKTTYDRFDLNMNAGGDYIYLCVSHDKGTPITKLTVGGVSAMDGYHDNDILHNMTNTSEFQNFNAGAGGTAIYAAVSCEITGWIINDITFVDRDINGDEYTQVITLDTEKKTLSEEQLKPIIDKGAGSYFQGFYTKKLLSDNAQLVTTSSMFPKDSTIWAHWKFDITVDFTAVGGTIETHNQVSSFPSHNEYPLYYLVFEQTGKKTYGGPHWPGNYIAVEYTD